MRHWFSTSFIVLLALAGSALAPVAHAQATRTWVSGVGDDANPCSRTAPCRTFAGGISKTAAGGTITVLDPGSYGAVTITKSITIESDGNPAGILHPGSNGVLINAAATDTVVLRNLALSTGGGTASLDAVRVVQVGNLLIEDVVIDNSDGHGISVQPGAGAMVVHLRDVRISRSGAAGAAGNPGTGGGILIAPGPAASVAFTFDRVKVIASRNFGISLSGAVDGVLRGGSVAGSAGDNLSVASGAVVSVDDSVLADASGNGALVDGSGSAIRLSRCTITGNGQGLLATAGGAIVSFGDNRVIGNAVNGAPTQTADAL